MKTFVEYEFCSKLMNNDDKIADLLEIGEVIIDNV